jgi:DNA-binding transcriptional LysR family regulator
LNLLLLLSTVLSERSVARAAKRLHVTPSAVSNGLAKLRLALGDPLVTRQGRGIVPTPRARELEPVLARALADLERATLLGPFEPAACARTFTLAMADALQLAWLPAIAMSLSRTMPLARLRVVGIESLLSLGDLASGEVDLHLGVIAKGPGIHSEPVRQEPTRLVARRAHPACRGKISRQRLARLAHVGVELAPGRGFRDRLAAAYASAGIERRVVMTVPSFAAAAVVASRTDFVTTLPASLCAALGERWGLRQVSGPIPPHTVPLAMCWHERSHADPAMTELRRLVKSSLASP